MDKKEAIVEINNIIEDAISKLRALQDETNKKAKKD